MHAYGLRFSSQRDLLYQKRILQGLDDIKEHDTVDG